MEIALEEVHWNENEIFNCAVLAIARALEEAEIIRVPITVFRRMLIFPPW